MEKKILFIKFFQKLKVVHELVIIRWDKYVPKLLLKVKIIHKIIEFMIIKI